MNKEALKKEAEEYALKQWEGNIPWSIIQKSYYDSALPREKRIEELEKENAELKKQHEVSARNMSSFIESLSKSENEAKKQLTKAKELLKWFVWYFREGSPNLVPYKHKVAEAEQFLKDSEVEK